MFLSSLPTWIWVLGALIVFCPIAGKQIAKDSLKLKNSFEFNEFKAFLLFPLSTICGDKQSDYECPIIKTFTEAQYIRWMMAGGVLVKLLVNFLIILFIAVVGIVGLLVYSCTAPFRGIFSTK